MYWFFKKMLCRRTLKFNKYPLMFFAAQPGKKVLRAFFVLFVVNSILASPRWTRRITKNFKGQMQWPKYGLNVKNGPGFKKKRSFKPLFLFLPFKRKSIKKDQKLPKKGSASKVRRLLRRPPD